MIGELLFDGDTIGNLAHLGTVVGLWRAALVTSILSYLLWAATILAYSFEWGRIELWRGAWLGAMASTWMLIVYAVATQVVR